jgi:hypothetical protein
VLLRAIQHFKTITLHKWYVMIECFKMGLYWQGLVHDLSKYSPTEFWAGVKYYQGDRTPIGAEKEALGYSFAWLHHNGRNKHHWEYWTDFRWGRVYAVHMPEKYVKEMFCDMVGASKAYLRGAFDKRKPLEYFLKFSGYWTMEERSKDYLRELLETYAGLR